MARKTVTKLILAAGISLAALSPTIALAQDRTYSIPAGDLRSALKKFAAQSGTRLIFRTDAVRGVRTSGVSGAHSSEDALQKLLSDTPFTTKHDASGAVAVVPRTGGSVSTAAPQSGEGGPDILAAEDERADPDQEVYEVSTQEIVVTATRREERLRDVPQSVTAVTASDIERLAATQLVDFLSAVPGVQFTSQGAGAGTISMRGVSSGRDIGRTVATYVDEVPYGSTSFVGGSALFTADAALFDLDRVEVLRGPQGTLYGASSMGGLLKYVTTAPSLSEVGGEVRAGIASTRFGGTSYNGNAIINAPLATDKAAIRASAFYSREGGYIDNVQTGEQNIGASKVYGGRVDLLLKPVDDLTIRLTGFAQNIRRNGNLEADYFLNGQLANGALDQFHPLEDFFGGEFRIVSGTISYDFGSVALTSISSYQDVRTRTRTDYSELYAPLFSLIFGLPFTAARGDYTYKTEKFTQEVRLASQTGERFEWQIGGFFTDETLGQTLNFPTFGPGLTPIAIDLVSGVVGGTYKEYAAFGNLTWHLTDKLDVTGGLRWSHNKQSYFQESTSLLLGSAPTSYSNESVVTYLANARYRFNPNVMAYARFATGYRPGGPNVTSRDPITGAPLGATTFGSDTLRSYEIGLKADARRRTFSIDASGYYIDWSNIQLSTVINGNSTIINAGGARIKGGELTLIARPAPGVTVSGAFSYNDAELTAASAPLGAAKGERLPNVPRFTAALNADYLLRSGAESPSVGATLRYVGDRTSSYSANAGNPLYLLPDYVMVDLRAGLMLGPVRLQAYVHNLFDERGQLSATTFLSVLGGPAQIAIIRPRTFGLSGAVSF